MAGYYEGTVHYLIVGVLPVGAAIAVYAQVTQSEFLLWDDPVNVVDDALVHKGLTVNGPLAAFKQVMITHWQPLTTISHMMDVSLYGMNPTGHHLANLILHIFNTLLLFMV